MDLSYEEVPVEILDIQIMKLSNKEVVSVKVLLRNHFVEDATWEAEANKGPDILIFSPLLLAKIKVSTLFI